MPPFGLRLCFTLCFVSFAYASRSTFATNFQVVQSSNKLDATATTPGFGLNSALLYRTTSSQKSVRLNKDAIANEYDPSTKNEQSLPASFDWRNYQPAVISPVKNQGACGSCWTFAASECAESAYALKTGKLVDLSEQQILDCTPNPDHCGGTGGCSGGTAEIAYQHMAATSSGGLSSEWTYPYVSSKGANQTCQKEPHVVANVKAYNFLPPNSKDAALKSMLVRLGPVAIAVDASSWSSYKGGVFECKPTDVKLNHAVQLVGYGTTDDGTDYWTIRNSWSPQWGEDGYIRIKRDDSQCDIDDVPTEGQGCASGPTSVKVCGHCGINYDAVVPIVEDQSLIQ